MSSNLRRKMIQKNIKKYSGFQINDWWDVKVGLGIFKHYNSSKQRYSKEKTKTSFENPNLTQDNKIPYYKVNDEIYNMIPCPSDSFMKGSNRKTDNNPMEKMNIEKPFLLGETEITQELYESVLSKNPSSFKNNPKNPVEQVSWYDVLIFCNRLSDIFGLDRYYTFGDAQKIRPWGYWDKNKPEPIYYPIKMNENSKGFRLPTEWEWEYAAKAGTQLKFSGSDNADEVAWYKDNSNRTTHPVKQKKPNAWGFYDMTGNVDEWCENKYSPTDTDISASRVYRGGGWINLASFLRSAYRYSGSPGSRYGYLGFRVCRYI